MIQNTFWEFESFYLDALSELGVKSEDIKRLGDYDIACKCPVCGDSQYGNKKRLHLYQKGEVINVNCFNGDCQVKNLTPWNFFKNYAPRVYSKYQQFNRQRYLVEISAKSSGPNKDKISNLEEDWDNWVSNDPGTGDLEITNDPGTGKSDDLDALKPTKLMQFIENFERVSRAKDLERIKNWLKENPDSVEEFRFLMK